MSVSEKRQPLCKIALPREQEMEGQWVGEMNEKSLDETSVNMSATLVPNHWKVTHRPEEFMSNNDVVLMD